MNDQLIREALEQYGLTGSAWQLIRHNENMTVQIGEQYLLRIHLHRDGFSTDAYYEGLDRVAIRRTELAFLAHLAQRGMTVQTPVPNRNGDLITMLPGDVCATVLRWIPGHTPGEEDACDELFFRVGATTARMHKAAAGFRADSILRYDAALCRRLERWLIEANHDKLLTSEHTDVMLDACRVMESRLEGCEQITVHADLSSSNMLITDAGLVPIDFSLMGLGHPMMDISALYGSMNGIECRRLVAEGYRSEGGVISFQELDACFALNVLLYIVLHLHSSAGDARFKSNLDRWGRQTFRPLADGKRLIGDDFRMLNVPDSV